MNPVETSFLKRFAKLCGDGYRKGWHERNGGNLSYRMNEEEVNDVKDSLNTSTPWIKIGASVPTLANEYFLVKCTGCYMMNMESDPESNCGIIKVDEKGENYRIEWGMKGGNHPIR